MFLQGGQRKFLIKFQYIQVYFSSIVFKIPVLKIRFWHHPKNPISQFSITEKLGINYNLPTWLRLITEMNRNFFSYRNEPKWNRNETKMKPKWTEMNRNETEMKPKWNQNEPKWNRNEPKWILLITPTDPNGPRR